MFLVDEIVSIEEVQCDSLRYDITVEDNNNFFANGILVHNCQNLNRQWDTLKKYLYECTEKLEGSSMTVGLIDGEFIVCSRNINLKETDDNAFWIQARRYDVEAKLRERNLDNIILQGELIGEKIQNGYYAIQGQDFYVFRIQDLTTGKFLPPDERKDLVAQLELKHVPVIHHRMDISNMNVQEVLEYADGKSEINPNKLREGLVFKRVDGEEHFKAVSNEYLMKSDL